MKTAWRITIWASALLWAVSWWIIYLEIHRWHHMTASLHLNPPPQPPGYRPARPGGFLQGARFLSVAAPTTFVVTTLLKMATAQRSPDDRH